LLRHKLCTIPAFPASQRCQPWLKSAAYDYYSIWLFVRVVRVDLVNFGFNSTRANAVTQYTDRWHIAYGFVSPKRTLVFLNDTDSFANPAATHRRAF
jgi:hypothetical protein